MPKLRPMRTAEEIAAVPIDKPVTIQVPDSTSPETPPEKPIVEPEKPQPVVEPQPEPDEVEVNPLQQQLDALTQAQELEKTRQRQRDQQRDQQHAADLARERARGDQAEYDSYANALMAVQSEADRAQGDLVTAISAGDPAAQAEAQRRLAKSEARIAQLEDAKGAIESRREEAKTRPAPAESAQSRIDAIQGLTSRQRDWLSQHPELVTDTNENARVGVYHGDAVKAGHRVDSDAYYQFLEERLGFRRPAPPVRQESELEPEREPTTARRSPPMSAPVSRDAPNLSTGRARPREITLSPEQRDAARISGVDDLTYAKGVLELERRKKLGMYPDR